MTVVTGATFFPTAADIRRWLVERENPTWRELAEDFGLESLIKKRWTPGQARGDSGGPLPSQGYSA